MIKDRKILPVIFLCSLSSLAYQIALTRIFSISLWYHFAFMIVSIAMLGIGASGTVLSLYSRLRDLSYLGMYSLLLGIGISLSYLISNQIHFDPVKLSWETTQLFYICLYYITLSVPFFFFGLIIATAFASFSERAGLIYGADLLGAGIGSIGILSLMTATGPDRVVFILSSIVFMASFVIGNNKVKAVSIVLILFNLSLLLYRPALIETRISPYKGLQVALRYPGAEHMKSYSSPFSRIDVFKSPLVRSAPGLSLIYLEPLPEQIGFSIDGNEIGAIIHGGESDFKAESLRFLKYLPSALPYEMGKRDDVLVLDPKGGLHVLVARHYNSKNIYKVESNPLIVNIIKKDFRDFSGNIYERDTWTGLGRSWLKADRKRFDIIDISLMGTLPSGHFGIAEDYRFTVEAFKEYLRHLKPEGMVCINLFILPPPRVELRILTTIIKAMEEVGIKNYEQQIVALRSWGSICILLKRSPFTFQEIGSIKKFSHSLKFDLIYYPGIKEEESNIYVMMPSNEYFIAFRDLLNPETKNSFMQNYLFDIGPVRDDKPFFHYYLKFKNIREIYKTMGEKWQYFIEEGYILPAVFVQVIFLSLILIVLPAAARRKVNLKFEAEKGKNLSLDLNLLPYFAFLGIGFMFVEISLIQRIILPLENPPYAVATVLTSLLIGSGIGSLLSYRTEGLRSPFVMIVLSFLIIIYSLLLSFISDVIAPHSLPVKMLSVFFVFMPLGFLMGIPFPTGLKMLGERNELLIPWAWAINGCFSVLSPILAIMLAMAIGFTSVLWIGAVMYLLAFVTLWVFRRAIRRT